MIKILKKIIGDTSVQVIKSFLKTPEQKRLIRRRREFYSQFLTDHGDIYFDVGANYGNRIEPIIDKGFQIIAVEPQSKCIRFLKWRYGHKITIVGKGLGEKEGVKEMYISNVHVTSSFSKDWITATKESGRFSQHQWTGQQLVEMTTLDSLIKMYGLPKFIKIDVEGFELEVLKGLSSPVEYISFEYTVPERTHSVIECIDRIADISKNNSVEFNYSIGESMDWALKEWLSPQRMKELVKSESFIESGFGDIYSRTYIQ